MNIIHESLEESERMDLKENIEIWEDIVNIKHLVISLIVCSSTTLGGYFIAPQEPPKPLFFGLTGAIIGFIICTIFIKPKRLFIEANQED
ncbi:hypothetical protein GOQ27_02795 [Clostridium sp. D2Q-11]|uniref:Heme ABC transporter n=1 Tax=Anaeromonas frigoriresistens TaxID=2683708 RepID=A0A942UV02_9FIRM|nr:hypothetical protein [Anaeromonas frigoriresistens]MBS4537371.1 hypothetical protein [Anaeromonas frigoriresistens]